MELLFIGGLIGISIGTLLGIVLMSSQYKQKSKSPQTDTPNDKKILIIDKSYLVNKNDPIVNQWITFEEFSSAVINGKISKPK